MTRTPVSKAAPGLSDGPIRTAVMFVRAVLRRFQVDDATFLAGGVAFNVLLAGIPFVLLLAAGLGFLLRRSPDTVAPAVQMGAVPRFLDVAPESWTLDPDLLRMELRAAARRGWR